MKRPSLKTEMIKQHASRRIQERLRLDPSHLKRIAKLVRIGQSEFLGRRSLSRSVHRVNYGSQTFRVVYDKVRHLVVTVIIDE